MVKCVCLGQCSVNSVYIQWMDFQQTTSADQRGYKCEYEQDEVIKREEEGECVSEK